jgi:hypothetical protein
MASSLSEIIRAEIEASQRERRDFSFSSTMKMQLLDTYGLDAVRDTLMQEIRRVGMPCIDPFNPDQDIGALISRVKKEAAKMGDGPEGAAKEAWTFKGAEGAQDAKKSILLTPSTSSGMLSTYFSGYERYHEKCHKSPTPAENWAR